MPFKEGVEVEHVHALRALVQRAKYLEEQVDLGAITPHEALAQIDKAVGEFPPPAKKEKK